MSAKILGMSAQDSKADFDSLLSYLDSCISRSLANGEVPVGNLIGSDNSAMVQRQMAKVLDGESIVLKEQERKDIISQSLDLFLETSISENKAHPQSSAVADLTKTFLVSPLLDFLTTLIKSPSRVLKENGLKHDQLEELKENLFKTMSAVGIDMSVASILASNKMSDEEKLESISKFDMHRLSDPILCLDVYRLIIKASGGSGRALQVSSEMLHANLPKIEAGAGDIVPDLQNLLRESSSYTEIFRALSEADVWRVDSEFLSELIKDLTEFFENTIMPSLIGLVADAGSADDPLLLAKFAARTFVQLFRAQEMGELNKAQLSSEKMRFMNQVISELIHMSFSEYGTLIDPVIVFLAELTQVEAFGTIIKRRLEEELRSNKGHPAPKCADPKYLASLYKLFGKEEFRELILDKPGEYSKDYFSDELLYVHSMLSKHYTKKSLELALDSGSKKEQRLSLRWAPLLLDKRSTAKTIQEALDSKDFSEIDPKHVQLYLDALTQSSEAGFEALLDLTKQSIDSSRPAWFYTRLVDSIFMMVEPLSVINRINDITHDSGLSEIKLNPIALMENKIKEREETGKLNLNNERLTKLTNLLIRFHSPSHNDHQLVLERIRLWLEHSASPAIMNKLADVYNAESEQSDKATAQDYLKYLRYVSSLNLAT